MIVRSGSNALVGLWWL